MWSRIMDHREAERVAYRNGIRNFQSFSQSETQELSSVQPLFHSETKFSSEVHLQCSVTSKPFLGWGLISNWWKCERVVQLFAIQLRGRIPSEQSQIWFFFWRCNLSRIQFQQLHCRPKIITPKPLIICGRVNYRWKHGRVLFDFGVQLRVKG
jgi:hypothetical protein